MRGSDRTSGSLLSRRSRSASQRGTRCATIPAVVNDALAPLDAQFERLDEATGPQSVAPRAAEYWSVFKRDYRAVLLTDIATLRSCVHGLIFAAHVWGKS